jgi:hypothetical protein
VSLPSFQPASSDIRINIYWFLGLVLSLTSALFGFLMKQWLKMYISWTDVSPLQDAVGLRQYRYEGMLRWQLPNIFTMLPVLLQVALILFLVGLVDFLVHLQFEVALAVSVVIGVCLAAVLQVPSFTCTPPGTNQIHVVSQIAPVDMVEEVVELPAPMEYR